MIGKAHEDLARLAYEFGIWSEDRKSCWTFEFKKHDMPGDYSIPMPTSLVRFNEKELLIAFACALTQIEIFAKDATDAELRATKYHLEDFRKLVFK